jgi:leucyl aminopeptidase
VTVRVSAVTEAPGATEADTVVIGLCEESSLPAELPPQLAALLADGEARLSFKSLALTHAQGKRWLLVGLGERGRFTAERARVAAAVARSRTRELSARSVCWMLADVSDDPQVLAALVHGTILADYSFDMHKSALESEPPSKLEELLVCAPAQMQAPLSEAAIVAQAVNGARDLQNRPANDLTPTALARYAERLGSEIEGLEVQVQGREGILERGMGAFAAVAQGSEQEPALITMRYEHPQASGPLLGLVGKAVTFDSGGISLKPGAKMSEMKFDMSGGAAVLEATAAIARLGLPVKVLAVIGATENLPSGRAVKPGDIVVAANGKTIEVNNTDAEGRLVLADCLSHAVDQGAQRLVDLATLTGAVIIALGSTYAGLLSNDDELTGRVSAAGERSGEIVWRLPLHDEYREMIKGRFGDLNNAPEERKAGTIIGATFLQNFVGEVPWVHLDIAGSAWNLGRAYAPKDASGYGVRLLVELARSFAD